MAEEFVRLANENRASVTGQVIDEQVQDFMRACLVNSAEHPPTPAQVERDRRLAASLGHDEPRYASALESSLYAARHAPERSQLLESFTAAVEAAYEREHAPARTVEYSHEEHDFGFSR